MKKILLIGICLILSLALLGCTEEVPPVDTAGDESPSETGDNAATEPEILTDSGAYVGQIDNNFIEIEISGVPEDQAARAFMLSPELREGFAELGLATGDMVKFDYFVNEVEQNVITTITVLESREPTDTDDAPAYTVPEDAKEILIDSGAYVGQIDNNFIEINISGVPVELAAKSFMLSPELREGFAELELSTGDIVKFDYYVNADNQNVILRIVTE